MTFASQNEEKLYKKWLKESPLSSVAQKLFTNIAPTEEECIALFRLEKERTKAKDFFPFNIVFKETFFNKLPENIADLSEKQKQFIAAMNWSFIINKIEPMNKVLEQSYVLFDQDKIQESLNLLEKLADAGHPEACYLFAAYSQSDFPQHGIYKNPEKAFQYAHKALEFVEHPRACLLIAGFYYAGIGAEPDRRQATSWVLKAERSAESDPNVYPQLAEYYQDGYIVERDVEKAAFYAQKAD